MRLCTIRHGAEQAAVSTPAGLLPLAELNARAESHFATDLLSIIRNAEVSGIADALPEASGQCLLHPWDDALIAPPYRDPPKLWGVGLNFRTHADDLGAKQPRNAPGSYMRPNTTIIGHTDEVILPRQSNRVTAEAELGIVIGQDCRNISLEEAPEVIFGYTAIIDMTAEDLLRENLRYILRSKAFDTFCAIGPEIVTADEIEPLEETRIATVVNGTTIAAAPVSAMMYHPHWIVSFHSEMMRLEAGDIIATGTPGAGIIRPGDRVEANVSGIGRLQVTAVSELARHQTIQESNAEVLR